jgi:uncharacterized HAD superfamily protein
MTSLALIDIDGVLANDEHRIEFALARRYTEYFNEARMGADTPLQGGVDLIARVLDEGDEVQYLTGRREDRRAVTTAWLIRHGFPAAPLHMRSRAETMPLANFKRKRIQEILDSGAYDKVVLYDDDPEVIRIVQEAFGAEFGVHCRWYTKHKDMVKKATS